MVFFFIRLSVNIFNGDLKCFRLYETLMGGSKKECIWYDKTNDRTSTFKEQIYNWLLILKSEICDISLKNLAFYGF